MQVDTTDTTLLSRIHNIALSLVILQTLHFGSYCNDRRLFLPANLSILLMNLTPTYKKLPKIVPLQIHNIYIREIFI